VTFEQSACEWLRYAEQDRGCKPSTMRGYRSSVEGRLVPAFSGMLVTEITPAVLERWRAGLPVSARMKNKLLLGLHGIFKRAAKLSGVPHNPAAEVELPRVAARYDIEVFSPEEVMSLVRAAADSQDAAIYLTAAFTGLRRGELIALRWRDIDFLASLVRVRASYAEGQLTTPKNGKVRAVPLAPQVASALARLGERERSTGEDDLVSLRRGRRLSGRLRAAAVTSTVDRPPKGQRASPTPARIAAFNRTRRVYGLRSRAFQPGREPLGVF
jgi:integrase